MANRVASCRLPVATPSVAQRMDICRMEIKSIRERFRRDDFQNVEELVNAAEMLEKWSEELRLLDCLGRQKERAGS